MFYIERGMGTTTPNLRVLSTPPFFLIVVGCDMLKKIKEAEVAKCDEMPLDYIG